MGRHLFLFFRSPKHFSRCALSFQKERTDQAYFVVSIDILQKDTLGSRAIHEDAVFASSRIKAEARSRHVRSRHVVLANRMI